jgi:cutinase
MNFLLVTDGVDDANNHVQFMIGNCPATFGNPVDKLLGPLNGLSPAYGPKTIDLCNANDPICGGGEMDNMAAHHQYVPGRTDQAASFVAGLV